MAAIFPTVDRVASLAAGSEAGGCRTVSIGGGCGAGALSFRRTNSKPIIAARTSTATYTHYYKFLGGACGGPVSLGLAIAFVRVNSFQGFLQLAKNRFFFFLG